MHRTVEHAEPTTEPRRYPLGMLASLLLATFIALLDVSIATVALPTIQRSLHAEFGGMQWVLDGFTVALAAVMLSVGALADRLGRKRVFLSGLSLFTLASAACALAGDLPMLVAARVVQGAAAAAIVPGAMSLVVQSFPDPRKRAQVLGLLFGTSSIALVAGPLIGGPLSDTFGWPAIFLINLPLGALAVILGLRSLPESSDPEHASFDPLGQILAIIWIGALTYGVIEAGARGITDPLAYGPCALAAVTLFVFVIVEWRQENPMLPVRLFTRARFAAINLASFTLGFGGYSLFLLFTLFLQEARGFSATMAGLLLLPHVLGNGAAAVSAGRLVGRFGPRPVVLTGYSLLAAGSLGVLGIDPGSPYPLLALVFLATGMGVGLSLTPTNVIALSAVPRQRSGTAAGVINTSRQTGNAFGIAVLGAIANSAHVLTGGIHLAVLIGGLAVLLAVALLAVTKD